MSYFDFTKQFWRSGAVQALSSGATVLYWYILDRFNLARWPEHMEIGDKEIKEALKVGTVSIWRYRGELISVGLIAYSKGQNLRQKSTYTLLSIDISTDFKNKDSSDSKNGNSSDFKIENNTDFKIANPPTPPYICIQDNNPQDSLSKTGKRARERGRILEKDVIKKFDLDHLLPWFFAEENEALLQRYAGRNGIPIESLRPLAEEVVDEWLLAKREFPDYPEAARALQNLMRAKYTHQQNQSKSQKNEEDTSYPDFGPNPFEGISPEFLRSLGARRL